MAAPLNEFTPNTMSLMNNVKPVSYQLSALTLKGLARVSEQASADKQNVVLCLHGWLDNAASFLPLLSCFEHNNIIAIDWPGHGHSEHRSAGAHYHFFDYVYDLLELCEVNQWQQVDIIGHSMGGMIGTAFAAAFPEKVRSLTLIDALGFICADEKKATQQLRSAMTARFKNHQAIAINKARTFSKATAVKARLSVSDLAEENATLLVERALKQKTVALKTLGQDNSSEEVQEKLTQYCWRSDNRLRTLSPYRLTLGQAKQLMQDIQCPVKLIYASRGLTMIPEYLPTAKKLIKNFSIVKLEGGHHIHMEQPNQVAKVIEQFLINLD